MLEKAVNQLKLEKTNSRALNTQNEELKKLIVKIGVNPEDKIAVQKLLQGAETEIQVLRKKLKLPSIEHPMATEVAEVEKEKETLIQEILQRNEEVTKLKEMNLVLEQKIDSHVFTIVVAADSEESIAKLTRVMIELQIAEK